MPKNSSKETSKANIKFANDLKAQTKRNTSKENDEVGQPVESDSDMLEGVLGAANDVEVKSKSYLKYVIGVIVVFVIAAWLRSHTGNVPNANTSITSNPSQSTNTQIDPLEQSTLARIHFSIDNVCYLQVLQGDTRDSLILILNYLTDGVLAFSKSGIADNVVPETGQIIYLQQSDCTSRNIIPGH